MEKEGKQGTKISPKDFQTGSLSHRKNYEETVGQENEWTNLEI